MPHAHPSRSPAIGLLVLRIGVAAPLLIAHGWSKLAHFEQRRTTFADPIGIGPLPGLVLTIFAEVFCSIAVMLGLFTRLAVIPPLVVMLVAFFVVHAGDPWRTRELPLVFAVPFLALLFTGPGRYSLDAVLAKRRGGSNAR
jgi:putative oxidoreductase